jgi:nucleotide-binding universal stress UspA family protein
MFEKILLPLDGSAMAERTVPHAIEFANIFDSKIFVLQVLDSEASADVSVQDGPLKWQLHKAKTELYLHKIANQIRAALNQPELEDESDREGRVVVTLLDGKVAESIVDYAHKEEVDLLIISSHGSSGLSRWNLNSITTKVVSLIYKSTLIIRGYTIEEEESLRPRYGRILLPIDCSLRSECSLTAAAIIAKKCQSHLILSSVIKPPEINVLDPHNEELQALNAQYLDLSRKTAQRYLEELSQRVGVDNEIHVIESNSVVQAIIDQANDAKVDLLVFCAHGHTGESSWPFGAVARSFIEYSTRPILVIQDLTPADIHPIGVAKKTESIRSRD